MPGQLPDLKKLHKIDPPKRFELTAAPAGEFLTAKQIYARYNVMRPAELALVNAELGWTHHVVAGIDLFRG